MKKQTLTLAAILTLGGLVAFSPLTFAAEQGTGSQDTTSAAPARGQRLTPQRRVDRLAKQLNLTEDQQKKVKEIYQSQDKELQKLREDTSIDRAERRTKITKIQETNNQKIEKLLNADQKEKWEKLKAQQQQRQGRQRGNRNRNNNNQ